MTSQLRKAFRARRRKILRHRNCRISFALAVGAAIGLATINLPGQSLPPRVGEIVGASLAISGLGFGVSVTALALVVGLSANRALATMMFADDADRPVRIETSGSGLIAVDPSSLQVIKDFNFGTPALSEFMNLNFVLVWTALANLVAAAAQLFWLVLFANVRFLYGDEMWALLTTSSVLGLFTYGLLQMGSTLAAIFRFADLSQTYVRADIIATTRQASKGP